MGDNGGLALVQALSARLDVPANWLVPGNGSECVLGLAATAFLEPGRSTVSARLSW